MNTFVKVDLHSPQPQAIKPAAAILCAAGLVAFPTEIIYGLGTHARDTQAVRENLRRQGMPPLGPAHRSRPRVR
ncbi:MAG: hypothetical protein ABSG14_04730 [Verrucomicrobiia bacterium]|jgi:L-threonylcarbamoyladenylate synthase